MPLNGLRWSRNSGSANCDMPQSVVFGRPGGVILSKVDIFNPTIGSGRKHSASYVCGHFRVSHSCFHPVQMPFKRHLNAVLTTFKRVTNIYKSLKTKYDEKIISFSDGVLCHRSVLLLFIR